MNKNSKLAKSQNKKRKNVNNNNNNEGPLSKKQKVEHTVHEGTVEYAHNVMNPFVRTNTRIPHAPMVSSQKVSAIVKGTAITNANGQTFISVAPIRAAAFDGNSVIVSDTAYAGTVFPSYGTANTTFFNSNSPYNLADLTYNNSQTFAARIVSTGLRTRYIGTELNKGGRVFSIDSEGHFPLDGRSLSEISEDPVSHEDTLNNEWRSVRRHTMYPQDFDYQKYHTGVAWEYTVGNTYSTDQNYSLGTIIQSAVINQPIEFEVHFHFEFFGFKTRDREVPAASDPVGVSLIQHTMADLRLKMRNHPKPPSTVTETVKSLASASSQIKKVFLGVTGAIASMGSILGSKI